MRKLRLNIQWKLIAYDALIYIITSFVIYNITSVSDHVSIVDSIIQYSICFIIIIISRLFFKIYHHIWRFEGVAGYLLLITSDVVAMLLNLIIQNFIELPHVSPTSFIVLSCMNLLICLFIRILYRYIYITGVEGTKLGKLYSIILHCFAGKDRNLNSSDNTNKLNIAVVGAGRTGTSLADEIKTNPASIYKIMFFIDRDKSKSGKIVCGVRVYQPGPELYGLIKLYNIQEIVIAIPNLSTEEREKLFEYYNKFKCKVKVYDYVSAVSPVDKVHIRDFDIEDLMERKVKNINTVAVKDFYKNKSILITGGGGSIGSELARQIGSMRPNLIILLDIYENGVYNLSQELLNQYGDKLNTEIEICSVCDKPALELVFKKYKPDIVIHAAAHKHVPLMEHNCSEAVKNNVFGTKNIIELSCKHKAEKTSLISTDKAVNPTNIMGATKRLCEMMFLDAAKNNKNTKFCITRFGNVLGSEGSVVPLFKKQITQGGPITITHKDIVRYFMTIPEASNLVLNTISMSRNGELFVLDMGEQVKIYDLAKKMIKVSGAQNIDIVEIGLRPGEKLFEEILLDDNNYIKTDNDLIYIEKSDITRVPDNFYELLKSLQRAAKSNNNKRIVELLKDIVPEYHSSDLVNNEFSSRINKKTK